MSDKHLCVFDDLEDPGSKGFKVAGKAVFVIRQGDEVFGYVNNCPHLNMPLEFTPDHFLDMDSKYILCANHGALFSINTGECLYGPCDGKGLKRFPVVVKDGKIYAECPPND